MTSTRTGKTTIGLVIGTAIAMTIGVPTAAQAQYYGSQGSFNGSFANRSGAAEALKRGQAAQNYRYKLQEQRYSRGTRNLLNGRTSQSQMLRERGNMARHYRNDVRTRQMFQQRYGIDAQRGSSYSSGRSTVSRSSMRTNGRKWQPRNYGSTASRSSMHTNSARYTRSTTRSLQTDSRRYTRSSMRSVRSTRSARSAHSAARAAKTARYAKYAKIGGVATAGAALAGVDPITLGIHAATNPKDFARKADYYARNPHKGVEQMGKNVVNNTVAIGKGVAKGACGFGNLFKMKRNHSRC